MHLFIVALTTALLTSAAAKTGGATCHYRTNLTNPILTRSPDDKGVSRVAEWPNSLSVNNTGIFVGKCNELFNHSSHAACVSSAFQNTTALCGRRLNLLQAFAPPGVQTTSVVVVDLCDDLETDGLLVTADAFWDLGGTLQDGKLEDIFWNVEFDASAVGDS